MLPRPYYTEQDIRKRQIDTLKIFNEHVTDVKENCEYRVDFVAFGRSMCLNVIISPDFPNENPVIFVNPPIKHPWVAENSNQVVGAPGLLNYTLHSDLGRVVQAIIREFQRSPASFKERGIEVQAMKPLIEHNMMFPELTELSVEKLQQILENTDLQDKLLETNPHLVQLDLQIEELMTSIEQIAQDNIEKQRTLDGLKTQVIERISTIVQMKINCEELNRKHQKLSEMYNPHHIRESLKKAAIQADEDAEDIAEQFLLGNIPVETFVSKFAERRALGQARRAREERLAHQLAQLDRATI